MKRIAFLMILGVAMVATSCYKDYIPEPPIDQPQPDFCVPPVSVSGSGWTATPTTATIDEVRIEGDYLKFAVSYAAQEPRPFDLDWDGTINNDQAAVTLTDYENVDDPAGHAFIQNLCFDLTSLRTAEHGKVKLNLAGYNGPDLIYVY
jgi:hypothetical protein